MLAVRARREPRAARELPLDASLACRVDQRGGGGAQRAKFASILQSPRQRGRVAIFPGDAGAAEDARGVAHLPGGALTASGGVVDDPSHRVPAARCAFRLLPRRCVIPESTVAAHRARAVDRLPAPPFRALQTGRSIDVVHPSSAIVRWRADAGSFVGVRNPRRDALHASCLPNPCNVVRSKSRARFALILSSEPRDVGKLSQVALPRTLRHVTVAGVW